MRIPKLILPAFSVVILMTAFISCEKTEYAQPDRNVSTQATQDDDRINDPYNNDDRGHECNGGG